MHILRDKFLDISFCTITHANKSLEPWSIFRGMCEKYHFHYFSILEFEDFLFCL